MSYKEQFEAARKAGNVEGLMAATYKWIEGDTLIGRYLGRTFIESSREGMPGFFRYTFETDEGTVECVMSGSFDEKAESLLDVGKVYAVTYKGKIDISGGHTFKSFSVSRIAEGA
jgi:hypothetical protein